MSKVMVVEDDASLREIYSIRITAEGYDVVSAGDGEEALAVAVREKPDLILADVMMPKISGFDMLDILRATPDIANIKVIMMTALSGDNQRERGERLGADRYLVKSQVGIEDMVNTIHEVLGDKAGSSPSDTPTEAESTPEMNPTPAPVDLSAQPAPAAAPAQPTPTNPVPAPQNPTPANPTPANLTPNPINPTPSTEMNPTPAPVDFPTQPAPAVSTQPAPTSTQPTFLTTAPAPKSWSLRPASEAPNGQSGQAQ